MNKSASASDTVGEQRVSAHLDRPELRRFVEQIIAPDSGSRLLSFTFPVPRFDPLASLEMLAPTNSFNFYWEKPDQELALAGSGCVADVHSEGANRFQNISDSVRDINHQASSFTLIKHSLAGPHFLGGFSFFDEIKGKRWAPFGSAAFTLPKWLLIRDGKLGMLTISLCKKKTDTQETILNRLEDELRRFEEVFNLDYELPEYSSHSLTKDKSPEKPETPDPAWIKSVEKAKELIFIKKFNKIVLAREVTRTSANTIEPTHVLNTLRNEYPSCYSFMVRNKDGKAFIGSTPERLVSFQKNYMMTESLAGSISRGKTATEDVHLEKYLLNSSKNRKEHQYVTSAIEKNLQPFIKKMERSNGPDVKKLKNVQHLYTPVRAWLKKDSNRFSILEKLHPTPAVGGHPRGDAVPYIKQLEQFDRGWYAGPVGWFNMNGGGEFVVAIRSSLVEGNEARVFAGCGIVEDSDPLAEWEETNLKLMPMFSALDTNDGRQAE